MYNNIGKKIKGLATAIFVIGAIAAVVYGITIMSYDEEMFLAGLFTMVLGSLAAWISSWMLYGFGELIDKVCDIERNTRGDERTPEAESKSQPAYDYDITD